MNAPPPLLIVFAAIIIGFLIVDLGFLNKRSHQIAFRPALYQSLFWIGVALGYGLLIYLFHDERLAIEFLSAYMTEKMLSVDNLFVIMLVFSYLNVDEQYHHRVLFWGILGAIILRGTFITLGALIISQFEWVLYIFGAILIYTAVKLMWGKKEAHVDFNRNPIVRWARRHLPFTTNHHGGKFFLKEQGRWHFTSLCMALLLVETTDIMFAFDSIPAVFTISQDFFIVFTSNIFAVMGLRALFFLVENVLHTFHHLQKGLAFILLFVGAKMLTNLLNIHISSLVSFIVILSVLAISIGLSYLFPKKI